MGTDNLFWKNKNRDLGRKSGNKGKTPDSLLILCEGEKTEPLYFEAFRVSSAKVKVSGCGYNTVSLVKKAMEMRDKAKRNGEEYSQVWSVFDKDSFSMQDFNAAIALAKREKIEVAYTNEAFELWYLLHFNSYESGISRTEYKRMLSKLLKHPYKKNSQTMYTELLPGQANAIKRAERLLKSYKPKNPGKDNPSTTVHKLVKELNRYSPKKK
ncbi:MAG: RloB domain-containing protein [bacterium]|nr:RloB domain-containing protein [bacterium]